MQKNPLAMAAGSKKLSEKDTRTSALPDMEAQAINFANEMCPKLRGLEVNQKVILQLERVKQRIDDKETEELFGALLTHAPDTRRLISHGNPLDGIMFQRDPTDDVRLLGAVYFFRELAVKDQKLAGEVRDALSSSKPPSSRLLRELQGFYSRTILSRQSPFSASLAREFHDENHTGETMILAGVLNGLSNCKFDSPARFSKILRRLINGAPEQIQDLSNVPFSRAQVKFLMARASAFREYTGSRLAAIKERAEHRSEASANKAREAQAIANKKALELRILEEQNKRTQLEIAGRNKASERRVTKAEEASPQTLHTEREPHSSTILSLPPRLKQALNVAAERQFISSEASQRFGAASKVVASQDPSKAGMGLPPSIRSLPTRQPLTVPDGPQIISLSALSEMAGSSQEPSPTNVGSSAPVSEGKVITQLKRLSIGDHETYLSAKKASALAQSLEDSVGYARSKKAWEARVSEVCQKGLTLLLSRELASEFHASNHFPIHWFSERENEIVALAVPPGGMKFAGRKVWGEAHIRLGNRGEHSCIFEAFSSNFPIFNAIQEEIERFGGVHVPRVE